MMRWCVLALPALLLCSACKVQHLVSITSEPVQLSTPKGKEKRGRKLTFESTLQRPTAEVWKQVSTPKSALNSMKPQAILKPLKRQALPMAWQPDSTYAFKLVMNGLFPYGKHYLSYEQLNHEKRSFQTREHGRSVPVWDHHLQVVPVSDSSCTLHEELVIRAGWINWYVAMYARGLFKAKHQRLAK